MGKTPEYNNPLVYQRADPYCYKHTDGYYYFTASVPQYDLIEIRRAKTLNYLEHADSRIIWKKHFTGRMGSHIWAPELHRIDGAWYIYFAAGDAEEVWNIRPYALVCYDENPMKGRWEECGMIDVGEESFSLDMTTFVHRGQRYNIWAHTTSELPYSSLYMAKFKNALERESEPMLLTTPEYEWEQRGIWVNEGPAVLIRNGKIFVTYSAANTGANYCMGLMWCDENDDPMDINSWHKSEEPVFKTSVENGQYGPGHNCFTTDGEHDVMLYHARSYERIKGDPLHDPNRHARAMVITYDEKGFPIFGTPQPDTWKDE